MNWIDFTLLLTNTVHSHRIKDKPLLCGKRAHAAHLFIYAVVTIGHNTVTPVKLLRATRKACLIDADRSLLHRFARVRPWNSGSNRNNRGSNMEHNRKSNNTCYQRKNTDKQFVTLHWPLLIRERHATIASYSSSSTEPGLDTNSDPRLILIASIDDFQFSQHKWSQGQMTGLFSPIFARRSSPS